MLDRGKEAKALADACCKACAHAQHLVEAIMACDVSAKVAPASSHRNPDFWRARGRNYLERYFSPPCSSPRALEHALVATRRLFRNGRTTGGSSEGAEAHDPFFVFFLVKLRAMAAMASWTQTVSARSWQSDATTCV